MKAIFTLTNTIPQYVASNSGPRQIFETKIRRYAADVCGSRACCGTFFLLTGPTEFSPGNYLEENGELFHSKVILSGINLAITPHNGPPGASDDIYSHLQVFAVMSLRTSGNVLRVS